MAKIFLDTNTLIDIYERNQSRITELTLHKIWLSPLSFHILAYLDKIKMPNKKFNDMRDDFGIISLSAELLTKASRGPTTDLEDNIQLHSAAIANCDYLLTSDKQLLKMRYFGQVEIVSAL